MATQKRPLSPHLQVYSLQLTSVLSITHRITGVALVAGLGILTWWLWSVASGGNHYGKFHTLAVSIPGQIALAGWLWALCFHLLNGIRHLVWDAGYCLDLKNVYRGGWIVVIGSVALAVAVWFMGGCL